MIWPRMMLWVVWAASGITSSAATGTHRVLNTTTVYTAFGVVGQVGNLRTDWQSVQWPQPLRNSGLHRRTRPGSLGPSARPITNRPQVTNRYQPAPHS